MNRRLEKRAPIIKILSSNELNDQYLCSDKRVKKYIES